MLAALEQFPEVRQAIGLDINTDYLKILKSTLRRTPYADKVRLHREIFFTADWPRILPGLPQPLLVIGNPPWVTNSALGALGSSNLPEKSNFKNHNGIDALTGKSNFDISEWMLLRILEWLQSAEGAIAMLCKTTVARKVLEHTWKNSLRMAGAEIFEIPAMRHFGAAVNACLLVCRSSPTASVQDCAVYSALSAATRRAMIGYRNARLTADTAIYDQWQCLDGRGVYKWRSGIKHDCAKVLEVRKAGTRYINGLGEPVEIEDTCLYPMLKGSAVANGRGGTPSTWMVVTQRSMAEDTSGIAKTAPKTWAYLQRHAQLLDRRASSIYKGRPRFCIFGVGEYSFAPWKVAICGFYKTFAFKAIGPASGKAVVLDDTSYFLACHSRTEAEYLASLLGSKPAQEFLRSIVFWDAKRPITLELLRRLDLSALARVLGSEATMAKFLRVALPLFREPAGAPATQ